MASIPKTQTALVVDTRLTESTTGLSSLSCLPLTISHDVPVPELPFGGTHVLIRVLTVALNPTDIKMISHFPEKCKMVGCDFSGIVENVPSPNGEPLAIAPGTRVCGGVFPYNPENPYNGSFAQWVVSDARVLLRVPDDWDDLQAAALGSVGWGTCGLAFYDSDALNLQGRPTKPTEKHEPVLIYGGGTATGTMAIQMLKQSGYTPIAVTSAQSAPLALSYGAIGTAAYTSPKCVETIKSLAEGIPIRSVLDCITTPDSVATCFAAMARTGGRYACLEGLEKSWKTRSIIRTKEVMGYEGLGIRIDLGPNTYSREANPALLDVTIRWAKDMQFVLDSKSLKTHPIKEVPEKWQGIINGVGMLQRGEVRGQKLVVRVASP